MPSRCTPTHEGTHAWEKARLCTRIRVRMPWTRIPLSRTHEHTWLRRFGAPPTRRDSLIDSCGALHARGADLDVLEANSGDRVNAVRVDVGGGQTQSVYPGPNRLLLNDGTGGLTEDTSSVFAPDAGASAGGPSQACLSLLLPEVLFVADVDGDGDQDIIHAPSESLLILINDVSPVGGLLEDTTSTFAVGTRHTTSFFVADVNGDGGVCAHHRATRHGHTHTQGHSHREVACAYH